MWVRLWSGKGVIIKEIKITGLDGLKTMPFEKFVDFQGNLKKPIEKAQLEKLKNSIIKHGIFVPKFVWFDSEGQAMTVDGHQTLSALRGLHEDGYAMPDIPFVEIDAHGAKDAAEKLLQINSRYAMIDPGGAFEWMQELDFEPPDIKEMVEDIEISELNDFDFEINEDDIIDNETIPEKPEKPITKRGDLYQLGKHFLLCGDSTDINDVKKLMGKEKANLVMTSPPYWVGKEYETQESEREIDDFISQAVESIMFAVKPDYSRVIINSGVGRATSLKTENKTRVILLLDKWINGFYKHNWYLRYIRCWIKGGGHSRPRRPIDDQVFFGTEFLLTFYKVDGKSRGQNRINETWMQQSNWTDIQGDKQENEAGFPLELPRRYIVLYSLKNEICFDPFLGNGTTLISCEQNNRVCYGLELDGRYCDVIIQRFVDCTGVDSIIKNGESIKCQKR